MPTPKPLEMVAEAMAAGNDSVDLIDTYIVKKYKITLKPQVIGRCRARISSENREDDEGLTHLLHNVHIAPQPIPVIQVNPATLQEVGHLIKKYGLRDVTAAIDVARNFVD